MSTLVEGVVAGHGDQALAVETYVSEEAGRWVVEIVVIFPDEAIRRTVNSYRTRRQAEIAAAWMKRGASRQLPPETYPDEGQSR